MADIQQDQNKYSSETAWAQGVLTLVSIFLGAALAVGAQKVFDIVNSPSGLDFSTALQAAGAFIAIAGTFYHFYTFTSFYYILPSFLWVILTIAVGVGVLMTAYSIGNTKHLMLSNIVFFASGGAAFAFALFELWKNRIGVNLLHPDDVREAYRLFAHEMAKNVFCFSLMGVATAALYYWRFALGLQFFLIPEEAAALVNAATYGYMVWRTENKFLVGINSIWKRKLTEVAATPPVLTNS